MVDFSSSLLENVLLDELSLVSCRPLERPGQAPTVTAVRWPNSITRRALPGPHDRTPATMRLVEKLGELSAEAQGLKRAITTPHRLSMSEDRMYILREPYERAQRPELVKAIGFIRVGQKSLYMADVTQGHGLQRHSLLCVLDFFVHPSYQRQGHGKRLFEHVLMAEKCTPGELGLDRPSPKFLAFMAKYYGLNKPVFQANRYVVYSPFFGKSRAAKAPIPYWMQDEQCETPAERKESEESSKRSRKAVMLPPQTVAPSAGTSGGSALQSSPHQRIGGAPERGTAAAPSALRSGTGSSSSSDPVSLPVPARSFVELGHSNRNGNVRLICSKAVNPAPGPHDSLVCNSHAASSAAEDTLHAETRHVTKPNGHSTQFAPPAARGLCPIRAVCPPAETGILGVNTKVANCTLAPATAMPLPASHLQGDPPLQHRNGQRSQHAFVNTRTRAHTRRWCDPTTTTMPDEPSTTLNAYVPRSNSSEVAIPSHLPRSHPRRSPWSYEPGESAIAALCNGKMLNRRGPRR